MGIVTLARWDTAMVVREDESEVERALRNGWPWLDKQGELN